jgi:hypothetical protein
MHSIKGFEIITTVTELAPFFGSVGGGFVGGALTTITNPVMNVSNNISASAGICVGDAIH